MSVMPKCDKNVFDKIFWREGDSSSEKNIKNFYQRERVFEGEQGGGYDEMKEKTKCVTEIAFVCALSIFFL